MSMVQLASMWRDARRIYPIYAALVAMFDIGMEPCRDLESPINRSEVAVMDRIQTWFDQVDQKIEVWQLRQLLQSSELSSDENLRALIQRHLNIKEKNITIRDKVDYLLVQYYAHVSPQDSHNTNITPGHVMEVLFPVLGYKETLVLPIHQEIEALLVELDKCKSLSDMFKSGVLGRSRSLKERAGTHYFDPAILILFTRCNFLMRLVFFRSMHAELHAIRQVLHELQLKQVETVDCTSVGMGANENLDRIRELCHAWKEPFRAAYSLGDPFKQIVGLRLAVETAMFAANQQPKLVPKPIQTESAPFPVTIEPKTSDANSAETQIRDIPTHLSLMEPMKTSSVDEVIASIPVSMEAQEAFVVQEIHATPKITVVESNVTPVIATIVNQAEVGAPTYKEAKPPSSPSIPAPVKPALQKRTQTIDMASIRRITESETSKQQPPLSTSKKRTTATALPNIPAKPVDDGSADLDGCLKMIFNKIRSVTAPGMTVMRVDITGTPITLASWEVAAFARGIDDVSAALRRCVGVRALLCVMLDRLKSGAPADLPTTLSLCHAEAALVQEKVAKAKDLNNIDAAVNLAATAKRMLSTVEEAEKFLAKM